MDKSENSIPQLTQWLHSYSDQSSIEPKSYVLKGNIMTVKI